MGLEIFLEVGIIVIIAMVVAGIMRLMRQPMIIGYILTGIIASFLHIVESTDTLETFSHVGISLLLFIVGLGLNFNMLRDVGKASLITGLGQVIFTSFFGFIIAQMLGFSTVTSVYIAVALTFSSTIIIMKLLSDKGDVDSLYGRISIGFLLVQDLIVVFALILITSLASGSGADSIGFVLLKSLLLMAGLIASVLFVSKYILDKVMKFVAESQEYLLLFSLGWCFLISAIFYLYGFSIEIGALLAGITLASTPYKFEISSKLKPIRDFFLVLFFVSLGSQMVFGDISQYLTAILIFSAFILIGNPLIVMVLMGIMGYTRKIGFQAGLTVAQISEFSIVLVLLGISVGHVPAEVLSLITVVGLITIAGSSYMILYSNPIYKKIHGVLKIFEKKNVKHSLSNAFKEKHHEVIMFGFGGVGADLLSVFDKMKKKILVVDYNPDRVIELEKDGFSARYGDASDLELLEELNLQSANMIVSTVPDTETNLLILSRIKELKHNPAVIVISKHLEDAIELYDHGASYVILPQHLGGHHVSTMIENYGLDIECFLKEKVSHLDYLNKKKDNKYYRKRKSRNSGK